MKKFKPNLKFMKMKISRYFISNVLFLIILINCIVSPYLLAQEISLTEKEQIWIDTHPIIRMSVDVGYGPYTFLDVEGRLQGVAVDFFADIERCLGIRFEIVSNLSWLQQIQAIQEHRLDVMATVVKLPGRETFLEFTEIYLPTPLVIMTRQEIPQLHSFKELQHLRLSLVEGYSSSKQLIAQFPNLRLFYVTTPIEGLRSVASGATDAYVGALGVNSFLAARNGITNLKVNAAFDMTNNGQRFGVRKDWPQLALLLDKSLLAISEKRRSDIFQRWMPPLHTSEIKRLSRPGNITRLFPWLLGSLGLALLGYLIVLSWSRQLKKELAKYSDKHKQAEKTLRDSEEKYRLIVDNAHDGIEITQNDQIIFTNTRFAEMLGYSIDELTNIPFNHIFTKQSVRETYKRENNRKAGKSENYQYEATMLKKDGTIIDVDVKYEIIDYKGKPATFAIIRDITENKQTEQKIKEKSLQLEKQFEKSEKQRIANLVVLNDLNKTTKNLHLEIDERKHAEKVQKVLYNISNAVLISENLEKLIGQIQKELGTIIDTKNFYVALYDNETDILSFPFYADEKDTAKSAPAGKTLTKYVIETKKSLLANLDVKKRFVRERKLEHQGSLSKIWLGIPLITEGKATGAFAVQSYTDENAYDESDMEMLEFVSGQISRSIERKKTYEAIKAALEKATESDRLKSAFLANMSHEIRTPMNGILGFVQLLKTRKLSGKDQNKYIGIIEKSGDRLLNIINDLINISKLESGQMDISISETNINKQIEYIYTFFKSEVEKKGMQIFFKNSLPDNEAFIDTDREKIYAILTNLVKNAIKYSNVGSIEFGYVKKENNLEFFVKDTGIGIPYNKQEIIFERFIQADLTLSSPYQGAGLGLSITKAYVEMLGGKIWVKSQEGVGSQFYFTIPCDHKTKTNVSKNKVPELKQEQPNKILKIMIVEDEKTTDVYLSIVVKNISKEILHAKTGAEALELFRNNRDIDLVLMDIKMPDMDGYDVTRKIREFNKDIVIIAQTAYALTGDREKALKAGCNDHITKPIEKDDLMKMIKKHLKV